MLSVKLLATSRVWAEHTSKAERTREVKHAVGVEREVKTISEAWVKFGLAGKVEMSLGWSTSKRR